MVSNKCLHEVNRVAAFYTKHLPLYDVPHVYLKPKGQQAQAFWSCPFRWA